CSKNSVTSVTVSISKPSVITITSYFSLGKFWCTSWCRHFNNNGGLLKVGMMTETWILITLFFKEKRINNKRIKRGGPEAFYCISRRTNNRFASCIKLSIDQHRNSRFLFECSQQIII